MNNEPEIIAAAMWMIKEALPGIEVAIIVFHDDDVPKLMFKIKEGKNAAWVAERLKDLSNDMMSKKLLY